MGKYWYRTTYPEWILQRNLSISHLELINTLVGIRLFAAMFKQQMVLVKCDNSSAMSILCMGRAKCPIMLAIARAVWYCTARYNFSVKVKYIAGVDNILADALSRMHKNDKKHEWLIKEAMGEDIQYLDVDESLYVF